MPVNWPRIGLQDLLAVLLQVVELAAVQRPGEDGEDAEHEHGRQGDEEVQDVHGTEQIAQVLWLLARRSEYNTTKSELAAMPSPAAQGGSHPTSARGTQAAL
jgi:hypothetical protein